MYTERRYKCIHIDTNTEVDVATHHIHNLVGVHLVAVFLSLEESLDEGPVLLPWGQNLTDFPLLPAFTKSEQLTGTFHPDYSLSGLRMLLYPGRP